MKLYFSPNACSLASHIALREAGLKFEPMKVDLRAKKVGAEDYLKINPKGYVPALVLDNGQTMTEGVAIMQWVADQATGKNLLPAWGTPERYKAIEWMNFIATEVHKGMSPMWSADYPDALRAASKEKLARRFETVENQLKQTEYILGNQFTVCDGYMFVMLQWAPVLKLDISKFPKLMGYHEKIKARPAVQEALSVESKQ